MPAPISRKPLAVAIAFSLATGSALLHAVELEEVIVTAQKREQDLQDTPIAVSAFNAEAITDQGIKDIADVSQFAPNVEIAPSPGGSTGATIGIRGSATINPAVTWEPTVGIYVDGVFVAKNVGGLFDVAELERIEVLRGPQGTLYGKNTVGGAINLITRKPGEEFGGTLRLGAGNYSYKEGFLSLDTGRLGETAAFNVAMSVRKRDGFFENTSTNPDAADEFMKLDATAMRVAGLFDVSDRLEAFYTFDKNKKDNTKRFGQLDLAGSEVERREEGANDADGRDTSEGYGHALTLTYDLSDDLVLKSITAYRQMEFLDIGDYDALDFTGFHATRDVESKQTSQELQLIGTQDSYNFILGAFYFTEDSKARNPYNVVGTIIENDYGVESQSLALFGQADWYLTDQWTLTGGIRWTQEEKEAVLERDVSTSSNFGDDIPRTETKDKWKNVSPMAVATYTFNDDISSYFKVAQGWKAGGFNGEASTVDEFSRGYEEEKVTSYELGLKSRWLENRVQANIALFQNDVKDIQLSHFLGAYSRVDNAGAATIKGLEVEILAALSDNVTANLNYGYLDAKYDSYVSGGVEKKDISEFPYSPKKKVSAGLEYFSDLDFAQLRARVDYSWVDDSYIYHEQASAEVTKIEAYKLWNARITLGDIKVGQSESLELALWGKNLTDEEYRLNGIPVYDQQGQIYGASNYYGDPRTYGVDVTYNF